MAKQSVAQISIDELKTIQLNVLQAIDSFCTENGISYSMACGTLLGAIRHKGYIPWDDDIDIYLYRADYNRLVNLFPDKYLGSYELVSLEREKEWDFPYAKAFDNRTVLMERSRCRFSIGVNIDIYPIDDVPDKDNKWRRYDRYRRFFCNLYSVKRIQITKERSLIKNLLLCVIKIPLFFVGQRGFAVFLSHFAQKYNGRGYLYAFECVQGLLQKNRFEKRLFESIVKLPFEDKMFCGFKDYDAYLKNAYGDYTQLPPLEKRVSHHDFCAWWK